MWCKKLSFLSQKKKKKETEFSNISHISIYIYTHTHMCGSVCVRAYITHESVGASAGTFPILHYFESKC